MNKPGLALHAKPDAQMDIRMYHIHAVLLRYIKLFTTRSKQHHIIMS